MDRKDLSEHDEKEVQKFEKYLENKYKYNRSCGTCKHWLKTGDCLNTKGVTLCDKYQRSKHFKDIKRSE